MYKIEFSHEQLLVLNKALVELPYKEAAPVINHINKQLDSPAEASVQDDEELPA